MQLRIRALATRPVASEGGAKSAPTRHEDACRAAGSRSRRGDIKALTHLLTTIAHGQGVETPLAANAQTWRVPLCSYRNPVASVGPAGPKLSSLNFAIILDRPSGRFCCMRYNISMSEIPKPRTEFSGQELADQLEAGRNNYRMLDQVVPNESGEQLRARYVGYTKKLIDQITDFDADYVLYLDKSARPVSWMVNELWHDLAPDKPRPATKYANIDRLDWREIVGSDEVGVVDVQEAGQEAIQSLRNIFSDPDSPGLGLFDGKRVMIVDEVKASGDTLRIAEEFIKAAFPSAEVKGAWWMISDRRLANGHKEVPVWYNEDTPYGRGVDNKNVAKSFLSPSSRQQDGYRFLSTPFGSLTEQDGQTKINYEQDAGSNRLRTEIHHMVEDFRSGAIPVNVEYDDAIEDYIAADKRVIDLLHEIRQAEAAGRKDEQGKLTMQMRRLRADLAGEFHE